MATIKGNAGDNNLYGTSSADRIYGYNGDDNISGGAGNDVIYGGEGNDLLSGGAGNDWLYAGTGRDFLYGGDGNDRLFGTGDDQLYGGLGSDILVDGGLMTGGGGTDTFQFTRVAPNSSRPPSTLITDFQQGEKIDLSAIDANTEVAGNQAFRWLGSGDFTGRAGEARYELFSPDGTRPAVSLMVDVDGDRTFDLLINIEGYVAVARDYVIL
jgi:Ca2+-binding RTX toxin-like protein